MCPLRALAYTQELAAETSACVSTRHVCVRVCVCPHLGGDMKARDCLLGSKAGAAPRVGDSGLTVPNPGLAPSIQ